jgi:hypothetical protein
MGMSGVSKSQVSRSSSDIDEKVHALAVVIAPDVDFCAKPASEPAKA